MVIVSGVLVGLATATVGCLVWAAVAGSPASVAIEGDQLVVKMRGPFVVLALRSRLTVPLNRVRSAEVVDDVRRLKRGPRVGTYMPGGTIAGNFGFQPNKAFWAVQHRTAVVIELDSHERYAKLVLEVDDPAALAALLSHDAGFPREHS